ncbi:hypothetical protein ACOSQ2_012971 [Xanthoceras sorbifolium]
MKKQSESLMIAGQAVSDDDLISQILAGLGTEYDYVVVNITSRQDTITLQEMQFLLMSYESRLAQHNTLSTIDVSNASANYANNYGNNNGMRGNNSRGRSSGRGRVMDPTWYMDSGATNHITADLNNLALKSDFKGQDQVTTFLSSHSSIKWLS